MATSDKTKYQNSKSYNGAPVPAGFVLVPMWIKRDLKHTMTDAIDENFTTWHIGGFKFLIGFAPIEEDRFEAYMSDFWAQINAHLEKYRPGRCVIGTKKDGSPKLCPKSRCCTGCPDRGLLPRYNPKKEELTPLSLDFCYEDDDFDIEDKKTITPEDHMMLSNTLDELLAYLKEQNPRYYEIALLGLGGDDRETIAKKLPLQKSRAYEEFNNALHAAEQFLYENK